MEEQGFSASTMASFSEYCFTEYIAPTAAFFDAFKCEAESVCDQEHKISVCVCVGVWVCVCVLN